MWVLDVAYRLVLHRWPIFFVPAALVYAGYTGWQVIVLTTLAIMLAEVAFVVVSGLLLDRKPPRRPGGP